MDPPLTAAGASRAAASEPPPPAWEGGRTRTTITVLQSREPDARCGYTETTEIIIIIITKEVSILPGDVEKPAQKTVGALGPLVGRRGRCGAVALPAPERGGGARGSPRPRGGVVSQRAGEG